MTLNDLFPKIRRNIAYVTVLDDGDKISEGSGFCFLPSGEIFTAAHTIAGGFPVRPGELENANRKIMVQLYEQNRKLLYKPVICPIEIRISGQGIKPLQLDIAIIKPAEPFDGKFDFLSASLHPPQLGDELYFGGYSNEIDFPFDLDRHIDSSVAGMDKFRGQFNTGIKTLIGGPVIKHGIVGNIIQGGDGRKLVVTIFYLDNQIHLGASGGPIVSRDGVAHGIIVKRAMTNADQEGGLKVLVPSGSTMGISLDILNLLPKNIL